ncbi:protein SWOLLEN 1-like isoform X2 [Typha angustifolia]|uniref:protein SWOLLEN 1-like isoform X2 n=1 Tax=Typha angustifolia TaxID=59011 RepID=UPI003C305A0C
MDSDDNDFQSQNFQLVVEDNNKFPPSLRPSAVPKFDIDEQLHIHLRFDNLVETEVLFGIQDQENWIDDFSTGSSAIEFSSSAAESCSISRTNNVWSEATSSESVEMLLKSVSEDDIVHNQDGLKDGDVLDQLTGTGSEMDPLHRQDNSHNSLIGDITDPTVLHDPFQTSLSGLHEDVGRTQPRDISQTFVDEKPETKLDESLLEKYPNSEMKSSAENCITDNKLASSSNNTSKNSYSIDGHFEVVQTESSLNSNLKGKTDDNSHAYLATEDRHASPDPLTYGGSKNESSPVSISNLDMGSGNSNNLLLEQIVEFQDIDVSDLDGLQEYNQQEALKQISSADDKTSHTEGCVVGGDLSNLKGSSDLEPSLDLIEMKKGTNDSSASAHSDGLLEAIAYPVNSLNKDKESDNVTGILAKELTSLVAKGDADYLIHSVEQSNEDTVKISDISEQFEESIPCQPECHTQDPDPNHEHLASFKEVSPENNVMEIARKDANYSTAEDENTKDSIDNLEVTSGASENVVHKGSSSPTSLCEMETNISSTSHIKLIKTSDTHSLMTKPNDDHISHSQISVSRDDKTAPSVASCGTIPLSDTIMVRDKLECSLSSAQSTDAADIIDSQSAIQLSQDKTVFSAGTDAADIVDSQSAIQLSQDKTDADPAKGDVVKSSFNNSTSLHHKVVVDQEEASLLSLSASGCVSSEEKNVEITVMPSSADSKSKLDAETSGQLIMVPETILDGSSMNKPVQVEEAGKSSHHKQPILVPPSTGASAEGNSQDIKKNSEANLVPEDQSDGQICDDEINYDAVGCSTSKPGSSSPSSSEAICGSPTVISSREHCQNETEESNRVLSDHTCSTSDNLVQCIQACKDSIEAENDKSFSFEVGSVAEKCNRDPGTNWKPFSSMKSSEVTVVSKENPGQHSDPEDGSLSGTITKNSDGDQNKQMSDFTLEKVNTLGGETREILSEKQISESGRSQCNPSPSVDKAASNNMKFEEMKQNPISEISNTKVSCSPAVESSNLPDLNTSICSAALIHQPFTDLQQVQLRAQIFVYGSLIQGVLPVEACMTSAFGESVDGGRTWEKVWRAAAEKFQNQKPPSSTFETPISSRSGPRTGESVSKDSTIKSKSLKSPASRSGSKVVQSALLSSTPPLPSPSWAMSSNEGPVSNMPKSNHLGFNQSLSPLHSFQSPQMRQYTGNPAPWFSQSPRPASWMFSPQSSVFNTAAQLSVIPATETAKVTASKVSTISSASSMQLVAPITSLPNQDPASISAAASAVQVEAQKSMAVSSSKSAATTQKPRKRKKASITNEHGSASVTNEHGSVIHVSEHRMEPAPATLVAVNSSDLSGFNFSASSPHKVVHNGLVSTTSHSSSPINYQIVGSGGTEQRVILSEEMCSKVEQAKLQAEDAAAHAASAVRYSQSIWSQLEAQLKSGLLSQVEDKFAFAAVAAAAAASVAKAAAEAAKVASGAAMQAKMMADEAITSVKTVNPPQSTEKGQHDVGKNLARLTPVSILKGKDKAHGSCSIISAAREIARKKVEAASAATKRAENLDAILKAAELAAEAVSQAGVIIALGDPLPFSTGELLESGPEGYWKAHYSRIEKPVGTNALHSEGKSGAAVADDHARFVEQAERTSNHEDVQESAAGISSVNKQSLLLEVNHTGDIPTTSPISRHGEVPPSRNLKENGIKKGEVVEVVAEENNHREAWFSARVLDVKDNRAFVCYINRLPSEGSGQLKEWIPLECDSNEVPRIRPAHPMTIAKFEGTRKRRREAVANYVWAVGDRVDAWIRDCWWEGIITEKLQGDETKFTIHFPASRNSSIVEGWNLRPSLVWKDGQWIEWSRVKEKNTGSYKGDSPCEKRQRLGQLESDNDPEINSRGTGILSRNTNIDNSRKPQESEMLDLSEKDRTFNVGKNVREENKADAFRVKRTGLQKEGSRVVFGVPRPGKKRKFMDVSKHYVAEKTDKVSEGNDSIKFAKYLMPQASRAWKSSTKVEPKGKRAFEPKSRIPKSVKSRSIHVKSSGEKESSSSVTMSVPNDDESGLVSLSDPITSVNIKDNNLEKKNALDVDSLHNNSKTADMPLVESSEKPLAGVSLSKKESSTSVQLDKGDKGKLTATVNKLIRNDPRASENKANPDAVEPRRSNRRIQPTSRLLEGLQSSLIMSKIPSVSHDKGARALRRSASSSRGDTHG